MRLLFKILKLIFLKAPIGAAVGTGLEAFIFILSAQAEDGYRLWLKYDLIKKQAKLTKYKQFANFIASQFKEPDIIKSAKKELNRGFEGLFGTKIKNLRTCFLGNKINLNSF